MMMTRFVRHLRRHTISEVPPNFDATNAHTLNGPVRFSTVTKCRLEGAGASELGLIDLLLLPFVRRTWHAAPLE